jgi:CPA2 family monovalent cation:H+ antiporter-2
MRGSAHPPDTIDEKGRVIIAGIGRFGQVVNRMMRTSGVSTVVLDSDMTMIETMRRFGIKGFSAIPRARTAAGRGPADGAGAGGGGRRPRQCAEDRRHVRRVRPDIHIVSRARDRVHVYELYQAGANDIVRETFDSSVRAGRYVLENMGFTDYEAAS